MDNSARNKLDIVLSEYKALRDEITDKFRIQIQIFALYMTALAIFYGSIFTHKIYDIIMALPVFSLALLFRVLWEQIIISKISHYIKYEIEDQKISMLVGKVNHARETDEWKYSGLWLGWQHSFSKEAKKRPYRPYYRYSITLLFFVISVLPSLTYNIYSIVAPFLKMPVVTIFPVAILVCFLVLNCSLGYYMYRIIQRQI